MPAAELPQDSPVAEPATVTFDVPLSDSGLGMGDGSCSQPSGSDCSPSDQMHEVVVPMSGSGARILECVPEDRRVTVVVDGVNAWVPAFFATPSLAQTLQLDKAAALVKSRTAKRNGKPQDKAEAGAQQPIDKQILFNINVTCKPGEVLALMGPSGGGKTSLLSLIGGRKPTSMDAKGHVLYNGQELTKDRKRRVGFVMQDDLLHETLTVWETLYFAAMLRLPKTMPKSEKMARVSAVVEALGLLKCKDTIIGGFFRRGVSGGERKRVSVGYELLINPSVLLLDEPTSGLDSTTALSLLETLRELAEGGRAIITTIHQPSSRLYHHLDSLLLLSQGHAMFYGEATRASDWFAAVGAKQPFGVNTADFILDCASGAVPVPKITNGEEARVHMIDVHERYLAAHPEGYRGQELNSYLVEGEGKGHGSGVRGEAEEVSTSKAGPTGPKQSLSKVLSRKVTQKLARANTWARDMTTVKDRWGASYAMQFGILFTRSVKTRRFESMSSQDLVQFLTVGVITGMLWWQRGDRETLQGANDMAGLVFFEGLFLSFRVMFTALFTFPGEFKLMLKERASGMYRLSAFYFARTASDLPMDWTFPTLFVIIIYWMSGLRPTAGAFFANWAGTMLLQMVAQSVGLLIGASVMELKTAQTIAAVIMLTFMLIGGFYVRNVPAWIDWLKYLSFMWYGNNLLQKIEFSGRTYYDCGTADPSDPTTYPGCQPLTQQQLVDELNFQRPVDEWPWEALVLLGYLLVLRVLVYVALRRKTATL